MIRNFLIVAVRNFFRQRTQSILNVSGLAIGMACSIYVFLYVFDELTYDTQDPDPLGWAIGVLSVFLLAMVTILTVSFHSLRVATANPVDSLKQE